MQHRGDHTFLVKWLYRPYEDATCVKKEELQKIDPELYEEYSSRNSLEPNFSKPGRVDGELGPFRTYARSRNRI